jgi:hypothetical protein
MSRNQILTARGPQTAFWEVRQIGTDKAASRQEIKQ